MAAAIKADQARLEGELKGRVEGVREFVSSDEGKKWWDEGVATFKDSEAGRGWAKDLGAEAITFTLKKVVSFVNAKVSHFSWEGCPYYTRPYSDSDDNIDSGDEDALSKLKPQTEETFLPPQALMVEPISSVPLPSNEALTSDPPAVPASAEVALAGQASDPISVEADTPDPPAAG